MPTVIDSLVVELGLDPSKLTKGQQEAIAAFKRTQEQAKKQGDLIEAGAGRIVNSLSAVQRMALGVGAILGVNAGFKALIKDSAQADAATGRLAFRLNQTTQELTQWRGAARLAGGSAEAFDASIKALSQDLNQFTLTGESQVIGYFRSLGVAIEGSDGKLRKMTDIMFDAAKAVERFGDPAKAGAVMRMIGIDEGTINLLMRGEAAMRKLLDESKRLADLTPEQADNAAKLAKAWERMTIAAENFGRTIRDLLTPSLLDLIRVFGDMFTRFSKGEFIRKDSLLGKIFGGMSIRQALSEYDFGASYRKGLADEEERATAPASPQASGPFTSQSDKEAFIRAEAAKRGIDPNIAMRVAQSEGFYNFVSQIPGEKSYGAFQLNISKNPSRPSLGDRFKSDTGLDPSDPRTEREGIRYALDEASKKGWGQWYGWKGDKWAGISRGGGGDDNRSTSTRTTNIGSITVNTQATDAAGIARDMRGAMERDSLTDQAQTGPL